MASKTFKEDIASIINEDLSWSRLQNTSILISGATGLIGTTLIRILRAASDRYELNLNIIGMGRNKEKLSLLTQRYGANQAICNDIRNPVPTEELPNKVDVIFHCAAITKSADMVQNPMDVLTISIDGTKNMLEVARQKKCDNFVYLSSMEVYGQTGLYEVCESDLGYLDVLDPRSCYPESKRLCENMCVSYAVQYDIQVKIARLAQTFGAGIPKDDTRVFAQFARSALKGEDIVLHTSGKSRGNYCYIADSILGVLYILIHGKNCEAYNVANPYTSVTIREMAEIVANEVCGGKINIVVEPPPNITRYGYAPNVDYRLNSDKLMDLGWKPRYKLKEMYARLLSDWRNE